MVIVRYTRIIGDVQYKANMIFSFPPGLLPAGKSVLEETMALLHPNEAGRYFGTVMQAAGIGSLCFTAADGTLGVL